MKSLWILCLLLPFPAASQPASWNGDLKPIDAKDWNYARAAHLLERAGFGGTPEEIERLAKMTLQDAVKRLVRYQDAENVTFKPFDASGIFPSEDFFPQEWGQPLQRAMRTGEAWGFKVEKKPGTMWLQPIVDYGYYLRFSNNGEIARVGRWLAYRMLVTQRPLEEKLAMFWHGHFATENDKVRDYRKLMAQWDLFRAKGNGKFGDLLLEISRNPAMLIYLDGIANVKGHPNENYAREILELFSLGVGNYSERDIKETARSFTGWGLDGNRFLKRANLHDDGEKTVFGVKGNFDGEDVVGLILKQPACAKFISRKLYRYFVRDELSPALEEKLAAMLRQNDYDIGSLLETVFLSRDFYSAAGTQIKNPVHLAVSTYRKLGLTEIPGAPNFQATTAGLGMALNAPPNVAGWKGGRTWINPATMTDRQNFTRYVLFPREIPPPTRKPMDFVPDIIGHGPFEQMNEMAKRGDFTSGPTAGGMDEGTGFNRAEYKQESYNVFRGVYNGAIKTFKTLKTDPPLPAKVDLSGILQGASVKDASAAVDYLAKRFLSVSLPAQDRTVITRFLSDKLGGNAIEYGKADVEASLREALHLILSMPEYQVL